MKEAKRIALRQERALVTALIEESDRLVRARESRVTPENAPLLHALGMAAIRADGARYVTFQGARFPLRSTAWATVIYTPGRREKLAHIPE